MKKIIAILLAVILLLSLCACGKSKEAQAVDDLIMAIGEVSLDSAEEIESAENAYNALSEKDRENVENYAILETSRETLDNLKELQETVDTTFELIDRLFSAGNMEAAEGLCYDLLNNEKIKLKSDEVQKANQILSEITEYCFAGTYLRFLYKGIIIKHNKTEPTYTKTSLFLCEKRRFLWPGLRKEGNLFKLAGPGGLAFFHLTKKEVSKWPMKK